ncbi:MAG: glutamine--fructose-6-phosphate transaminase (isomerizing) [Peptostreptococcaceae bacterium]|nr:glutamine--fructose-6-phosphate transaminase (isomerizing) [Peptostreptococcaceae bacterium]
MCGIVGYIGSGKAEKAILKGLEKLEYRGYDSAGIALIEKEGLFACKSKGRMQALTEKLRAHSLEGSVGIGHTRWATHGAPSDINSHPHLNQKKTLAVVHNGIVENYIELKEELIKLGYIFLSETDTEVIVHLIDRYYEGDLLKAVRRAARDLRGAYALGVISSEHPDEIVAVRMESPLVVGIGKGESLLASDIPALLEYTNQVLFIENGEFVRLQANCVTLFDAEGEEVSRELFEVDWDIEAASKGGYEHFTLKEIMEQPRAIEQTLGRRLDGEGRLVLEQVKLTEKDLAEIRKICMVGCGSAYHAGLVGSVLFERWADIRVENDIASEFRYKDPRIGEHTLMIAISQSGETADTLAAVKEAKRKGARILSITNVVGSSITRISDDVVYTWAGPEIGVCSTKAYTTQLLAVYMLALHLGKLKKTLTEDMYLSMIELLSRLPKQAEHMLLETERYQKTAARIRDARSIFYIGRGLDRYTALEGALKLKEISYIHTEAFAAGELKHGTIALIEEGTPVIVVCTQRELYEKTLSNVQEVRARGAYVIGILPKNLQEETGLFDEVMLLEETSDVLAPILAAIPTQLIAYHTAALMGNDVDKPRNLAKSVTVE